MPNPYFQFKQFTIQQGQSAMKVTTDACVLGALANKLVQTQPVYFHRGLDIGAGTGVLSLMLTQDTSLFVDAVEMDRLAATECASNVQASPFANRITVHPVRIEEYKTTPELYDIIICNPPFFKASLPSPNERINLARHEDLLSSERLLQEVFTRMTEKGTAMILMPADRDEGFRKKSDAENLFIHSTIYIQHTELHQPFRVIYLLRKFYADETTRRLVIRDNHNAYTKEMQELMQPFYLKL
ncbi:MAG: methyltransferase [Ferruginibacter sp.]|nr:methyltransferase [Ferruginibacter sp.]